MFVKFINIKLKGKQIDKKTNRDNINHFNSNQIKNNNDGEYDSYSSEDENFKKTGINLNSSVIKPNSKTGGSKIRSSAPLLSDKISLYQKEKNQKIAEKLYMPFIKDKTYKLEVNKKLTNIKEDSKNNAIFTHKLIKKRDEVDKIGKQLFIYNNPSKLYFNYSN